MDTSIELDGLTKRYGETLAVDDLSFRVEPGRVTGFVGPNGAGKSSTIRLILGLNSPDSGSALVNGAPFRDIESPLKSVGALLDARTTHPGQRARDHLLWMAQANDLPTNRVHEVLEQVGLSSVASRRTGGFSLGMSQRLGIAAALLGNPPILVLDEPINGLDPEGILWIRDLMRQLADEGRVVFVSSHIMSELEGSVDHIIVIARGRLIADSSVSDLLATVSDSSVTVRSRDITKVITSLAASGATVTSTQAGSAIVSGLSAERIAALIALDGLRLDELTPHHPSLEEAYLQMTRGLVDYRIPSASENR
jgi:ABC-2 type transport system ATP-binding protein